MMHTLESPLHSLKVWKTIIHNGKQFVQITLLEPKLSGYLLILSFLVNDLHSCKLSLNYIEVFFIARKEAIKKRF